MNENRRRILELLAQGKITPDQAELLIAALPAASGEDQAATSSAPQSGVEPVRNKFKFIRVLVEHSDHASQAATVNVRVPIQLLRAGVRLTSLIPPQAHEQLNEALTKQGVPFNLSQIKPENLEELVENLQDFTVDIDDRGKGAKVKVFCE
jgi:hypothetical protein